MTTETNVDRFEALEKLMLRQRAIRIFDGRDVDDAVIERAIRVATFAPNGGNRARRVRRAPARPGARSSRRP